MIRAIASQQLTTLRRSGTFLVLVGVMLLMTLLAGFIGWMSHHTILKVYDSATQLLADQGAAPPLNPFAHTPELALLSNMSIYVPLIGALVAIVIGHLAIVLDRAAGRSPILFSRPVSRGRYVAGKLVGTAGALALVVLACSALSIVSLTVVNGGIPAAVELARILAFYAISLLYMFMFALVGMVFAAISRSRSIALVAAIGVWLAVTFAVPQVTSGLRPTTSLNPVTDPVNTSQTFFQVTRYARPVSTSEQYKRLAATTLQTAPAESATITSGRIAALLVPAALLAAITVGVAGRPDKHGAIR